MPTLNRLAATSIGTKPKGRHPDGGGLYLNVTASGSRSWVFVWKGKYWITPDNKTGRRELGLGGYGEKDKDGITLKKARELAADCRILVSDRIDPKKKRDAERDKETPKTFSEVGHEYIEKKSIGWRNAKHRKQWIKTIDDYSKPIGKMPIAEITKHDVLKLFLPLWKKTPATARRVLRRIENIMSYATAHDIRVGDNPADWKVIKELAPTLSKDTLAVKHHKAIDYNELPSLIAKLQTFDELAAKALILTVLSATRTNETLNAEWTEFDLEQGIWIIPKERMKMNKAHAIPLPDMAISMLRDMQKTIINKYVFYGRKHNKPLSNNSMLLVMRRNGIEGITSHGMRSAFRSWVHDKTSFEGIIAEQALAHSNPDKIEAAYLRSTAFDKRRSLMQSWCDYCRGETGADILDFNTQVRV